MIPFMSVLERIPAQFVAGFVCMVAAWGYLRLLTSDGIRKMLMPVIFDLTATYVVVTKFSGLLLHPTEVGDLSLWTILAQAPDSGWFVGLIACAVVAFVRLQRSVKTDKVVLYTVTNTALFSASIWFAVRLFVDKGGFLIHDVVLCAVSAFLLFLSLRNRSDVQLHAHRVWIAWAALLLLTSTLVPAVEKWALFTPVQWCGLLILAAGLTREAMRDLQGRRTSTRID